MQIQAKRLSGVPVRTRSGMVLGRCSDVVIDSDTGHLLEIRVRTRRLFVGLDELVIAWSNIISMSETEIVVADAVIPHGAAAIASIS